MNFLAFLRGEEKDDKGRMFSKILSYSDFWLEHRHDYIQRVFPTTDTSSYSSKTPVLTEYDIDAIRKDETAKKNISEMYQRMLVFWTLQKDCYKVWGDDLYRRSWNKAGNHNHKRMTRVLKSLRILGLDDDYKDFCMRLRHCMDQKSCRISDQTRKIWNEAMML